MAQAPQQQSGGGGSDNAMAPVWITVLLFITAYFIWAAFHVYIVRSMLWIVVVQSNLVRFFLGSHVLVQTVYLANTMDPASVSWNEATGLLLDVGQYMKYPFIGILGIFAIWMYQSDIRLKFKRQHNMNTLRTQEQYNWKAIMPVVPLDLVQQDISEGTWAMALSPMEFARKYNLLRKEDALLDNPLPGDEMTAGIRKADAKRVFTLQLGPYWDNVMSLPPHTMALFAVFASRINRDRQSATLILEHIDITYSQGKVDYSVAKPIVMKYLQTKLVQEVIQRHAYVLTVMASMLQAARNDGVVPSAEFLWLKPIDRRLWYMLNCVGRQTPYAEVGGAFAHWKAELSMGRRSLAPMIDEATKALGIAVKQVRLSPKEMQELKP